MRPTTDFDRSASALPAGAHAEARENATLTFLLFSGHNERAVVTLCRYFTRTGLDFAIVAAGEDDAIHRTAYRRHVVLERSDAIVDLDLFARAAARVGAPLAYCPTTEFINDFALRHRGELAARRVRVGLPERAVYQRLTGKWSSQQALAGVPGLSLLPRVPVAAARAPCVLKPIENIAGSRVLYPKLCPTPEALAAALEEIDPARYFAQPFVEGQSHYLCAYLARDGARASYWQQNLLQQPDGKSIVLARTGANPGLDEAALFERLHALGFHGPFMMEVIADAGGLHYIEINPRFWGPLQLALDACPELLQRWVQAELGRSVAALAPRPAAPYYAWAHGARLPGLRRYPAAAGLPDLPGLLRDHDLYAGDDTAALRANH